MQRILGFVVLAFLALACSPSASESVAADADKDKGKGVVVNLDGAKSKTPGDWKEEAPANRMRLTQFRLPKKGDDKDDAELVIFQKLGGGSKANITRWKGQFVPPEGKKIDEVAEVKEIKIGDRPATYLDVRGTYKFNPQPFNPRSKTQDKPNYRMLAIYFDGPKDPYQIKLTGPAKTVEAYKKGFDEWLKNFK
ncbi:MAG TPA: hypothetical protein VN688_26610 [Gemmataceae bacterium]|nr:hypothetical protein [Gemmataceae bacterium]